MGESAEGSPPPTAPPSAPQPSPAPTPVRGEPYPPEVKAQALKGLEAGGSIRYVAKAVGVADSTLRKWRDEAVEAGTLKLPPPRATSREEEGDDSRQSRLPRARSIGELAGREAATATLKEATTLVHHEAALTAERITATGRHAVEQWGEVAAALGLSLPDYLDRGMTFYQAYEGEVTRLRREIALHEAATKFLLDEVDPRIQTLRLVSETALAAALAGHPLNPDDIKTLVWGAREALKSHLEGGP